MTKVKGFSVILHDKSMKTEVYIKILSQMPFSTNISVPVIRAAVRTRVLLQ